jgi:hypothetical protein
VLRGFDIEARNVVRSSGDLAPISRVAFQD